MQDPFTDKERVLGTINCPRLVGDLILEACRRPRRVVDGRMTEGVVQDQRPAGGAFIVLPQPGRHPVQIQEPRGLLVATKRSLVQFQEELGIGGHCGHFWTSVPDVVAAVLNNVGKSFDSGPWGPLEFPHKVRGQSTPRSTTVPTRQANNLKVYRVKRYAKLGRW